ncbi:UNVERIFIED_CONTAM: hypothetical protein HDU68_008102 [Siphonaria sp. JEL0065]|nr:hypothetical protein HDU68_008102 [Siphonaria sp. JEL0065]
MTATTSRSIFVALDESTHATSAFNFVLDNIAREGEHVTAVVVIDNASERDETLEKTKTLIRAIADPDHLNVKFSVQILVANGQKVGPLLCQLVDEQKPAMLVLGSAGKSHIEGMLIGSVSNYAIANANVPVIVARLTPADEARAQKNASRSSAIGNNHAMWV